MIVLAQVPETLARDPSVAAIVATSVCIQVIRLWVIRCRTYSRYPAISVTPDGLAIGSCAARWAEISAINVITRTMAPRVEIEMDKQHRGDGTLFPGSICLTAYRHRLALLRALKERYEASRPGAQFAIPASNGALVVSWLAGLCGSALFILGLMLLIGAVGWRLHAGH